MRILLVLALVVGWTAAFRFNFKGGDGNMPSFANMFQPALPSKDSGSQTENQGPPLEKNSHFGAYRKRPNTGMWGEHGPESGGGGNRGDGPARPGRKPSGQGRRRRPNSSKDQKKSGDRRMKYGSKADRKGQMWGMDEDGEDCPMQNKTLDLMQLINETYHKMQELATPLQDQAAPTPLQDQAAPTANQTAIMKDFARSFKRIMFHGPHGEPKRQRMPRRGDRSWGKKGGQGRDKFDMPKLMKNIDVDEIVEGVKGGKIDMNKMMDGMDWSAVGDMMKKFDWNDISSKMNDMKSGGGLNGLTSSLTHSLKDMFPKSGGSNGFDWSKMMGHGAGGRKGRSQPMGAPQLEPSLLPDPSHQGGSQFQGSQFPGSQFPGRHQWGNRH